MSTQPKLFDDQEQLSLPEELMAYTPSFFNKEESDHYFSCLSGNISWQQGHIRIQGREISAPRLSAWLGQKPAGEKKTEQVLPWTPELRSIKESVEAYTGTSFNAVLLNYYRNGQDSVAWHSDKHITPGAQTEIASLSLGQPRHFDFRHKTYHWQRYSLELGHGSLLLMKGDLQQSWEHRIAKSALPMSGRINLTFRKVPA